MTKRLSASTRGNRQTGRFAASLVLLALLLSPAQALTTYYVAPTAQGTGTGTTKANAALYTSTTFWNTVQTAVGGDAVDVIFTNGTYSASLALSLKGNASHVLTLAGETDTGMVFSCASAVSTMMSLAGCRNMVVRDFNFRGDAVGYALTVTKSGTTYSNNVTIESCTFIDMVDLYYGALGVHYLSSEVLVVNNIFQRCGSGTHFHFIYSAYDPNNISVYGNIFEDCAGSYVRFRDNADYGVVMNNYFHSTGTYANENSGLSKFIEIPVFNDVNPGDETIASNYTVSGNTFHFASVAANDRRAYNIHHSGYDPVGLSYLMTASEGTTLLKGTPAAVRSLLLGEADIDLTLMLFEGNSYVNCDKRQVFESIANYGSTSQGWDSNADISRAIESRDARMFYDFELDGEAIGGWVISEAAGTVVEITTSDPAEGLQSLRLYDNSATGGICTARKYIAPIKRGYFSGWYKFGENNKLHYVMQTDGSSWVRANSTGNWANGNGDFSPAVAYNADQWYFVEMKFDCDAGTYSVWVDGARVANNIAIHGGVSSMSGSILLEPTFSTATGEMFADNITLLDYDATIPESSTITDGFERDSSGSNPYQWLTTEYSGSTVVSVTTAQKHSGANSVSLDDNSASYNTYIRRTISPIYSGYMSGWFRFAETNAHHYPFYSNACYWLIARSDGKWGNGTAAFSPAVSYSANTWYHAEISFDFHEATYSVWINGALVADDIAIPTAQTSMNTDLRTICTTIAGQAEMWVDDVSLVDVYGQTISEAALYDGFESASGNPAGWSTYETVGSADVNTVTTQFAVGAKSVYLNDTTSTDNCSIRRSIGNYSDGYFSIWARFGETSTSHYPVWTDNAYWVIARSGGTWGNGDGAFPGSPTYVANQWYHIELTWDYDAGTYTVWVDGDVVADNIAIPGTATAFGGELKITPATLAGIGQMWVDEPTLVDSKHKVMRLGDPQFTK